MRTEIIKLWLQELYEPGEIASYQEGRELGPIETMARKANPLKKKRKR